MEADKDAIFEGEIEVISKEDFLKNITVANRLLSLVIDNPRPDSDIITADNSGIIPESHSNTINNPEIQAPQSLVETQNPSQGVTLSIPDNLTVGPPTSSSNFLNTGDFSDLAINTSVIPEVQLPVSVSFPSQFFLQHEDVLSATLGNIYH
ncbi:hypothetical protein PPACK8108_LOCUS1306 [Phakopsora pachyrhizi]|uniref:Uncharacterized protein n=1 Tax=Phakopsora pachyrhizi TaxID=170000 RepID=A0AAV0AIA1_PHAPC|nr:hypothetical protein PPACK8108_LOCUS1306 [Phakopsora pachyrhizi]